MKQKKIFKQNECNVNEIESKDKGGKTADLAMIYCEMQSEGFTWENCERKKIKMPIDKRHLY